ncbi:MAG: hypothetical protein AUJ98_05225 [Bacteroidetes bacterium CG2_30_33_31]|nr:MAG: hypothetical protein AUJ98_05225 [Bacteroidetes bacterium CG2_30_33_31]
MKHQEVGTKELHKTRLTFLDQSFAGLKVNSHFIPSPEILPKNVKNSVLRLGSSIKKSYKKIQLSRIP